MRALRVLTGLAVLAMSFAGAALGGAALGFHVRRYSPPADIEPGALQLIAWIGWPQMALLFGAVALYFIVALKLFRRVKAHRWHAPAVALHAALWGWGTHAGVIAAARPGGVPVDLYALGAGVATLALVMALGRTHLD